MAETDAEVGSLQAEFAALRHQIAAELGARDVPPPPPAPAPQTTSVAYTGSRPSYDELQPPDAEVERMAASASTVVLQPAAPELPDDLAAPTAQDSHVAIARDARAQEQALHEILNRSNEISRATIVSAGGA